MQLPDIVATGKPAVAVNAAEKGAGFFMPLSQAAAKTLASALNLTQPESPASVLDLATGSGVCGIALAQASSQVRVRAVDWPDVLPFTWRMVEKFGVGEQFIMVPGDLLEADFAAGHPVAILRHILHSEGVERSQALYLPKLASATRASWPLLARLH